MVAYGKCKCGLRPLVKAKTETRAAIVIPHVHARVPYTAAN